MEEMESLYGEYCVEHELRWADERHDSFYLYFSGGKDNEYRLFVSGEQVVLEKERKLLFRSKWYPVSSRTLDLEKRTFKKEVHAKVKEYLQEFRNKQRGGKIHYGVLLQDCIADEIKGEVYQASNEDKAVFGEMLKEINAISGQYFKYFAELDHYHITGAGEIVRKYIDRFQSEWPKAMLLSQMWMDKIDGCDELILNMYYDFKKTAEYLPRKEQGTSCIFGFIMTMPSIE